MPTRSNRAANCETPNPKSEMRNVRASPFPPIRGWRVLLAAAIAVAASSAFALAAEVPEQFRVWGKVAKANSYLGEAGLDSPGSAGADATDAEKAAGLILFARPAAEVVKSDFVPAAADRCTALAARDCPGQYGPITFGLVALKGGEFSVAVSDLVGPGGKKIGAENFDVRAVRFVKVATKKGPEVIPLLIEAFQKKAVPQKRIQQFWITYQVPSDAAPGAYQGKVQVLLGGQEKAAIPLQLEVYPFKLVEPDVSLYIYAGNSAGPNDKDKLLKELIDQRCHGMNLGLLPDPVTREGDLSRQAMTPLLDLYKKVGFTRPDLHADLWNRITAEWLNSPDQSIKMWGPWFRYYPFSEKLDNRFVDTVKMLREESKSRGLELVLSVADEPGSHPWTTEATQHYNDLIKAKVPDVLRELTTGGGWAMGRPEDELWKGRINIWMTNRWLVDKLELVRKNDPNARIGIYNMGGNGSGPGGLESVRNMYGFFCWKAGACAAAQWVYWHNATAENNYTWPGDDAAAANVPTLRWEMLREGAKDRRYLATLEARLAGGTGGKDADEARQFLQQIKDKIELRNMDYDPIGGGRVPVQPAGTYDQWRTRIAEYILKLTDSSGLKGR